MADWTTGVVHVFPNDEVEHYQAFRNGNFMTGCGEDYGSNPTTVEVQGTFSQDQCSAGSGTNGDGVWGVSMRYNRNN